MNNIPFPTSTLEIIRNQSGTFIDIFPNHPSRFGGGELVFELVERVVLLCSTVDLLQSGWQLHTRLLA